jgi:hypothetical protein
MFKARVTHAPYFYLQIRVSAGTRQKATVTAAEKQG